MRRLLSLTKLNRLGYSSVTTALKRYSLARTASSFHKNLNEHSQHSLNGIRYHLCEHENVLQFKTHKFLMFFFLLSYS